MQKARSQQEELHCVKGCCEILEICYVCQATVNYHYSGTNRFAS